jgi:DNA mismatch endonuclease (patch repair protein)
MVDRLSPEQRSLNMSRVRGKDTAPEITVRRLLHADGLRFRLHRRDLPGRPDIVLPRHRAAVQVHGCFWHGHSCPLFRLPATRTEFWRSKINANRRRDAAAAAALCTLGWRVMVVWECALRGPGRLERAELSRRLRSFTLSSASEEEATGHFARAGIRPGMAV